MTEMKKKRFGNPVFKNGDSCLMQEVIFLKRESKVWFFFLNEDKCGLNQKGASRFAPVVNLDLFQSFKKV